MPISPSPWRSVGFLSTAAFARYLLSRGTTMTYIAAVLLVSSGRCSSALAALGILRFPDVYTRLHAASKAGPLGAGLILLGVGVCLGRRGRSLSAACWACFS